MELIAIPFLGLFIARGAPDPQQHLALMIWSVDDFCFKRPNPCMTLAQSHFH
jgi:hypothetical protein